MITDRTIAQAYSDLSSTCGGLKEDYFGLLYLKEEHGLPRGKAVNQTAFGGHDYAVDGFHFDEARRNLYIYQFKYSENHALFKDSLQRLIDTGVERIFSAPNHDHAKNQILIQLRACLHENRHLIEQVCFRFVFTGDPTEAERSQVLDNLREKLEDQKYLIDGFFKQNVGLIVDFRSSNGRIGAVSVPRHTTRFTIPVEKVMAASGPAAQQLHLGMIRLADLQRMHADLGSRFFDRNIRYGLGEGEAVNRAITRALRQIVIDSTEEPEVFCFDHNGITLFAEQIEWKGGQCTLTAPRLLNGAQTVTTASEFLAANKKNPQLDANLDRFEAIRLICRIITKGDAKFITRVTINNNRQNPVEPWNLHANDEIQLELQDKFSDDLGIYYERQENAFQQLSLDDLEALGIKEDAKAVQMLRLTQTFVVSDGQISRLSKMRQIFEDEKLYEKTFRKTRLKADSRQILLCYKVQFRLRKLCNEILQKGESKYTFIHKARLLLWALVCQGVLNDPNLEDNADEYGKNLVLPAGYSEWITHIATYNVRTLLSKIMQEPDYKSKVAEDNYAFLRTDRAFERCMEIAYDKWSWVHKKLQ